MYQNEEKTVKEEDEDKKPNLLLYVKNMTTHMLFKYKVNLCSLEINICCIWPTQQSIIHWFKFREKK